MLENVLLNNISAVYNVLVFPSWFPSKESPLNAIFTKRHVEIIASIASLNVVYAEKVSNQKEKYNLKITREGNYVVYICYYRSSKHPVIYFRKIINLYRRIISYIKSIKATGNRIKSYDFIHIHVISFEALIPLFFKIFMRIPYFVSEHSTMYLRETSMFSVNNIFKRVVVNNSSGLSVVSESLKDAMIDLNINHPNFLIIPNYVDDKKFANLTPRTSSVVKFLHVSRLDEEAKNVIGILNAFERVFEIYKSVELHIVGGSLGVISDSELYSATLKSKPKIFFEGLKLGDDILNYYNESDLLIMFSNYETQGVVAMEALFCGKPVLATALPCLKEYLHKKNSVLISPNDEEALTLNILSFLEGKWSTWNSEEIRNDALKKFSPKEIQRGFSWLYSKGLN